MKKPTKKQQVVKRESHLLESFSLYTSEDLRNIADQMDRTNITSLEIDQNYSGVEFYELRPESELEAEVRYKKEMKKYETLQRNEEKKKEREKATLIKMAKKFGLVVQEE
jgi:hypothetical protein